MNDGIKKILIVVVLLAAIGAVIAAKQFNSKNGAEVPEVADGNGSVRTDLPLLLELGSVECIPCKAMKPIIDSLKVEYEGLMNVEFIDVWVDLSAKKKYNIGPIPTQIFFDAEGKELFRHEGFYPKEAILAKWKELGVELIEAK